MNKTCPGVVVIEDDEAIRESIVDTLRLEGYEATGYRNGQHAIEGLADCAEPCLILLDLMMPVMDGWGFLEARKHLRDTIVATPVFIVSAWAEKAIGKDGVTGVIKKPVDLELLLHVVESHCGLPKSRAKSA